MAESLVRIFVSSPSDVRVERARVERVAERLSGIFDGLRIETYRWESGRYFSAHESAQSQIPPVETFDLVVGLFWSRLGLPVPQSFPPMPDGRPYPSGTAYEILKAIEHRQRANNALPDVLVYRKTAPPPISLTDREKRAAQVAALDAVDLFVSEWFFHETEGFRAAFKSFETTDQFEALFEDHLRAWLRDNRRLGRERRWRVEEQGSPFRGLEPFDASHREVFFGRGADVERARERLEDRASAGCAFLLIEGASGTGKSSLARAGLLPRLQDLDLDLRSALLRPGTAPLAELTASLYGEGALPELAQGDFPSPAELAAHLTAGGGVQPILRALDRAGAALRARDGREQAPMLRLVLLVDQLEELFGQAVAEREREAFAAALASLARSGRVAVVATLRADAHAAALAEPTLARLLDEGASLALGPPGTAELAEIVRAPAEAAALAFARRADGVRLDEVLIRDAGGPEALPLLQFALDELYRRAVARVREAGQQLGDVAADEPVASLSFDDYAALGGLGGAVRSQAEAAYAGVSPAAQGALPRLVRALTDLGPQGTTVLRTASMAEAAPDEPGQELLEALARARILVREESTVRFSHEAVLQAWERAAQVVQEAATFLRVRADVTRMEQRWREGHRRSSLLIPRGVPLAEATATLASRSDELAPELRQFIDASQRRARMGQTLTAGAAVVFAGVAVGAGVFRQRAEAERRGAEQARVHAEVERSRAEEARVYAEVERTRAEEALRTATGAANTLVFGLAKEFKDRGLPSSITQSILGHARTLQDNLAAQFPNDPGLLASRAAALMEMGDMLARQGDTEGARTAYEEALVIRRELLACAPENVERAGAVAHSLQQLGELYMRWRDPQHARGPIEEALAIRRNLAARQPENEEWLSAIAYSLTMQGDFCLRAGETARAREALEESLVITRNLAAQDTESTKRARDLTACLVWTGDLCVLEGDTEGGQALFEESLTIERGLVARAPEDTELARSIAVTMNRVGGLRLHAGDTKGALAAFGEELAIGRNLVARDPENAEWATDVSDTLNKLGDLYLRIGDNERASVSFEEALAIALRFFSRNPDKSEWAVYLADSLNGTGELYLRAGDAHSAQEALGKALAIRRDLVAREPTNPQWVSDLVTSLRKHCEVSSGPEKRALLEEALEHVVDLEVRDLLTADQKSWPDEFRAALASLEARASDQHPGTPSAIAPSPTNPAAEMPMA